jgi:zinc transporter 5/7
MVGSISIQLAPSPSSHDPSRPESSLRSHHYANVEKVTARARRVLRNTIGGLSELIIQVEPTGGFS